MHKNYFLMDAELENTKGDFFNSNDFKKNIFKILDNNRTPYNIAVIGKWGLGKSSLINMVKSELENKADYKVIQINAWKYEKEALARVFLRQILLELGEKKDKKTTAEMFNDEIKECLSARSKNSKEGAEEKNTIWGVLFSFLRKNWLFVLCVFALSVILYGIYKCVALHLLEKWNGMQYFVMNVFTGYCRNVGVVLILPIFLSLLTMAVERLKNMENSVGVTYPAPGVEDYEILLERKMRLHKKEKIVVILDDLDRLSAKKMVEALDAIKVFINYSNFVFIVPFDDDILKNAMRDEKIQNEMGVLDKLFQYKIYLPPIYPDNIKDYAANICKENLKDFMDDYCSGNYSEVDRIIRNIIIHPEVETPRQVKKLVNTFVNNQMIGMEREKGGKVEKGFASSVEGMRMIAKLSVLQADFKDFYDLMLVYPNAMELVVAANNDRQLIPKLPVEIKELLKVYKIEVVDQTEWHIDKANTPLINFLTHTVQYKVNTIESYLYMTMDDIAIKAGSKKQQEFLKMVTSGNMTGAMEAYKETPEVFESATRLLKRTSDNEEVKHIVCVLIYMFKDINAENLAAALDAINIRAQEFAEKLTNEDEKQIDFDKLMYGYEASRFSSDYLKIVEASIKSSSEEQVFLKLQAYMDHIEWFKENILEEILRHITWVLENNLIKPSEFWILSKKYTGPRKEWSEAYYRYLIQNVIEEDNRDTEMFTEIPEAFGLCATKENASGLWRLLEPVYDEDALAKLFLNIVVADKEKFIPNIDISKVIDKQIITDNVDFDNVNKLILERDYEPDDIEAYINFINSQSDRGVAAELILAYKKEHGAEEIQPAVLACMREVMANPNIECAGNFGRLIELCDKETRTELVSEFNLATKYNSSSQYEYPQLQKLYEVFANKYWEDAKPVISRMYDYVMQINVHPKFADLVVDYTSACYNWFDDNMKDAYLEVLKDFAGNADLTSSAIKGLVQLPNMLLEKEFVEIEKLLSPVIDDENCYDICKFYKKNEDYINTANKNLKGYIEANINVIKCGLDDGKRRWALQNLRRKYIRIGDEYFKDVFNATQNADSDVVKSANQLLAYYLDNYEKDRMAKNAIWMLKHEATAFADSIINSCKVADCAQIADYILSNQGVFDVTDILALLGYIHRNPGRKMQHNTYRLLSVACEKCSDTSERKACVEYMSLMTKKERGVDGKFYPEMLEKMMAVEADDDLREEMRRLEKKIRK